MYDFNASNTAGNTHRCSAGRSNRFCLATTTADVDNAEKKKRMCESFNEHRTVPVAPLELAWQKNEIFFTNVDKYNKITKIDSCESTKKWHG